MCRLSLLVDAVELNETAAIFTMRVYTIYYSKKIAQRILIAALLLSHMALIAHAALILKNAIREWCCTLLCLIFYALFYSDFPLVNSSVMLDLQSL